MTPAHVVEFPTPKGFLLRGLWYGPKRARNAIVFVHGLGGSAFSIRHVIEKLVDRRTAILAFNNRGHDMIARVSRIRGKSIKAGLVHEVFADCVDDIQGAIDFARGNRAKNIFLAGHSTGCQKSIYWASKKKSRGVRAILLLAPVSDYADMVRRVKRPQLHEMTRTARSLVRRGKKRELLTEGIVKLPWGSFMTDAQRFLSLYTPDSKETIFPYEQPRKIPRTLRSVKIPILAVWAEKDEYADRPARKIKDWFQKNMRKGATVVIPGVKHNFKGGERAVSKAIRKQMKETAR
ncbi:MAG: alpha/beta fold hydrolase [Candidatus Kaiserbacteria bacterium]|nr:MAG: alpha/beta fold hydrolase [Candidatus Kaiserbacteria bacterium]